MGSRSTTYPLIPIRSFRLLYAEEVDVDVLDAALERARAIVNEADPSNVDPAIVGYVILDVRGRLFARGYKR